MVLGAQAYAAPSSGLDDVRFRAARVAVRRRHSDHASGLACRGIFSSQLSTSELAVGRGGDARVRCCRRRVLRVAG